MLRANLGPGAVVGWLREHASPDGLAGCAFLIGPDVALTCAHVVGAHLGLPTPVPKEPPTGTVTIRFEALQEEVTGQVLPEGWFSNVRSLPGGLSDIAVVRLDKPVEAIPTLPAIAQYMPGETRPVLIHGAEADYKSYGQQVQGRMSGANIPRGWRQIDPDSPARGFTVKNGFSGSPVLDDLGNVVWGMIVAVADASTGVAYAIPAEHLWTALLHAGANTTVRLSDATDRRAEEAMAKVRAEYEAQLSQRDLETDRMRRELDQLRQGVRGLEQEARKLPDEEAHAALNALAAGNVLPATAVLRQRMEERLTAAREARHDAATTARQLGSMLKLIDSAGALSVFHQAAECDPEDFWTWIEASRLEQVAGTLDGAARAINMALQAAKDDIWSRAVALNEQGDLCRSRGDLGEAVRSYQASLLFLLTDRLAYANDQNVAWQRELSISHTKIGDVQRAQGGLGAALTSYQASFKIAQRLSRANPDNAGWQRDLSVAHNKIGDVHLAQGCVAAALDRYETAFAIRRRLAQASPSNVSSQRDLLVSHERVGAAQWAQGNLKLALGSFQASLVIAQRLAQADPSNAEWQRDLSVTHTKVGDVQQAQGDLAAALTSFENALTIMQRLDQIDPGNTIWQRGTSVSHAKVGDVQRARGELPTALASFQASLAITNRLAQMDPGNAEWQRDLSISQDRIGDVQQAQGDVAAALRSFDASLVIAERLARLDPANIDWQRDRAVAYERLGGAYQADDDGDQAIAMFQRSLSIYEEVQQQNQNDAQTLLYSVVPLWRLGCLRGDDGKSDLEAALVALKALAAADQLDSVRQSWIPALQEDIAAVEGLQNRVDLPA